MTFVVALLLGPQTVRADGRDPDDVLMRKLNALARRVARLRLDRVGVLAFEERGHGPTHAGEYVADLFDEALSRQGVDRLARNSSAERVIWNELCKSNSGFTNEDTAVEVGDHMQARFVVHGILTELQSRWRIRVRVIDIRSTKVLENISETVPAAAIPPVIQGKKLHARTTGCGTDFAASTTTSTPEPPTRFKVGVMKWGGFAGGIYFNGGKTASKASRFYKDYNLLVEFEILESIPQSIEWWRSGDDKVLWITVDDLPTEYPAIRQHKPRLFLQTAWSRGEEVMVARRDIKTLNDLRGKKVALVRETTAHSFYLISLDVAGLDARDVTLVPKRTDHDAADAFIRGEVDAAIVWLPEDERCVKQVRGAHRLETTKDASYLIAESLIVKEATLKRSWQALSDLAEGWLRANGEINHRRGVRPEAARLMATAFGISRRQAHDELKTVRLTTLADNKNFFGLNRRYKGETGADLYRYFVKKYKPRRRVPWTRIADSSIVQYMKIDGPGQSAEPRPDYAKCRRLSSNRLRRLSNKAINVEFQSDQARLSSSAIREIETKFGHLAEIFLHDCVRIVGNTDNRGRRRYNIELSERRARSVEKYLERRYGFHPDRFIVEGHGPDFPVGDNNTAVGRAKNRRTDIELLH